MPWEDKQYTPYGNPVRRYVASRTEEVGIYFKRVVQRTPEQMADAQDRADSFNARARDRERYRRDYGY